VNFEFPRSLLLAALLLTLAAGCSRERAKNEIIIGLNPSERSESVGRNADVLARMISARAGMPVKIFVAQDYSGLVEALRGRTIDFAFFAPVSYVFAERIADARVLLKAERKGKPYYYGCVVVNADSSYRTLADLKGKNIAWVDPTSASGHIFPKAALIEAGIDPDTYFGRQTFAGGHDAVLLAVINGTITAGATFANDTLGESGSWTQLGDGAFAGKVRPIYFSKPIPGDNLATTQYMLDNYPEIVEKVKHGVSSITDDSAGRKLMQSMYHVDAMIPAASADYDPVRRAADLLHLDITGRIGSGTDSASLAKAATKGIARRRNSLISTVVFSIVAVAAIAYIIGQTVRERRRARPRPPATASGSPTASSAVAPGSPAAQFSLSGCTVAYHDREGRAFTALRDVSLEIPRGQFVAVIGLSGAGKSTLLRCLNRMNEPEAGSIVFEGRDVTHIAGGELAAMRARIGFIFQGFNLVRNISVLANVLTGRLARVSWLDSMLGRFPRGDREIALRYLREVGLGDKIASRADKLSGGQQQRVAIARALTQQPAVILADEPMASLDPKLSEVILGLLRRFNREEGITVVVNLHVLQLARDYADRVIGLRAGEIVFDGTPEELNGEMVERVYGALREEG
jgi:phosphonate transport system ATP-binding protein